MSQRQITVAEYISWTDLLADAIQVLFAAKGVEATPDTAAYHCAAVRNAITALAQPDEADITVDLLPAAVNLVTAAERESDVSGMFAGFNSAVTSHLGQDLNTWLSSGGLRVHHLFRRGGNTTILPANVFPPVTVLGSMAVTGAGAGTFTDGQAVDTARYGGAQMELEVTGNAIGAADIVATVSSVFANGTTDTRTATIPNGSIVGAKVALGTSADRIVNITGLSFTGGTNGDTFRVQTIEDRDL